MNTILSLKCLICGQQYQPDEVQYVCPNHGNEGIVDVIYDYDAIAQTFTQESLQNNFEPSIWRYRPLLPISADATPPNLTVGWTPLYEAKRLANQLGLKHIWIKDEGRQPTGSLKDRASAIAIIKAQEQKASVIATASTGNAATALSGLCASIGQPNVIFVPEQAPQGKIAQLLTFGSTVILVKGSYDDAFELCLQAVEHYGWYNRNTGYNPYMSEGKKTVSYEICEQLNWQVPDSIFVSVGDGCIIGGIHKGLKDLYALGWIDKIPRIFGIQAEGSNFLTQVWENNEDVLSKKPIIATTVADSLSANLPRDRLKALRAVVETNGAYLSVSDEEILTAIPILARRTGVFAEPAGATAYAGLVKAVEKNLVHAEDRIIIVNTGNGLKDINSAMEATQLVETRSYAIVPTLTALQDVLPLLR